MIYINTVNLWDGEVQDRLRDGSLVLQRGQWMTCGANNDKRCRYVGMNQRSIHVVHWQGSSKATNNKFIMACHVTEARGIRR